MRFRYSRWSPEAATDEQRLQHMLSMFSYLVTQTSGDVEEALEWLKQLAEEYGLFDEDMTLDDLIDRLREMGLIQEAGHGLELTPAGIKRIRQDALREIFTSLKKAPLGTHESPFTGKGVSARPANSLSAINPPTSILPQPFPTRFAATASTTST
jgi:hypothetical protein